VLTEENLARMYGVPVRRVEVRSGDETISAIVPLHGLSLTEPASIADG
jgi:iron complex transport system ATP-binding protein